MQNITYYIKIIGNEYFNLTAITAHNLAVERYDILTIKQIFLNEFYNEILNYARQSLKAGIEPQICVRADVWNPSTGEVHLTYDNVFNSRIIWVEG